MKRKIRTLSIILTAAVLLGGCTATQNSNENKNASVSSNGSENAVDVTFTDAIGNTVTVSNPKTTIMCMGSFAETWILAGGELAAVTQDAFDEKREGISSDVFNLGSLHNPSAESIISLNPDFVVMSANISDHVDMYDTLKSAGINVAYFDVETFDDYLNMLNIFTDITGRKDLYKENGTDIKDKIDSIISSCEDKQSPTVLFIRAFSTGAKAKDSSSMTGHMLEDLGAANIADLQPSLLEDLSMEEVIKQDPDFIFVTTMGSSDEAAIEYMKTEVESNPAWSELSAVKNGRYIILDKNLFHYKPNARWSESYEILADYLYPEK